MKIQVGSIVKVKTPDGVKDAIVIEKWDPSGNPTLDSFWWVEYVSNGSSRVQMYNELDILEWVMKPPSLCECGKEKTDQPRHSYWCPLYQKDGSRL